MQNDECGMMNGKTTARQTTPVAIAVVEHGGRYLIGQRPPDVPLGGLWEFPGGKTHAGETAEQAAVRECLEEAGLSVTAVGVLSTVVEQYPHGLLEVVFVACRLDATDDRPRQPFLWVPAADLSRYEFPSANAQLIRRLSAAPATP